MGRIVLGRANNFEGGNREMVEARGKIQSFTPNSLHFQPRALALAVEKREAMILLGLDCFVSSTRACRQCRCRRRRDCRRQTGFCSRVWSGERESGRARGDVGGRSGKGEREELGKAETLAVWDSGTLGGVARRRGTGDGGVGGQAWRASPPSSRKAKHLPGWEDQHAGRSAQGTAPSENAGLGAGQHWHWQETREGAAR